jgi:hypothetical protein
MKRARTDKRFFKEIELKTFQLTILNETPTLKTQKGR